jgi:hypothetical protein
MEYLTFSQLDLKRLLKDARKCWPNGVKPLYGDSGPPQRGFWLVGDQGVYLMHNGAHEGPAAFVAYAAECNPEKLSFDEWWDAKRATFGGDDGVEYIEPGLVEKAARIPGAVLKIKCTPSEIEMVVERPRPPGFGKATDE